MSPHRAQLASIATELGDVLRSRADAAPLPRAAFVDPASLALDERALFRGRWVAVASRDAEAGPGSWVRAAWPGRGDLVVARTADLEDALLSATCRHRGVALLEGASGRLRDLQIACPYHGWAYDLGGELRRAPGLERSEQMPGLGLRAGRVAALGEVVLAALDPAPPGDGPPLPPWLQTAPLGALRRVHESAEMAQCNWKLCVANFQESHHFQRVHPALEALTPFAASSSVIPETGEWLGGVMTLQPDRETVSATGHRDSRPFLVSEEGRGRVHDAWLPPNLLTSLQPDYLLTYRLEPQAVDRTRIVFAIDVHASAPTAGIADGVAELARFWATVNAEDRAICEAQQRGLAGSGPGFRMGPYAASEDGLHAFEQHVARAYLALTESDA